VSKIKILSGIYYEETQLQGIMLTDRCGQIKYLQ